MKYLLISIETQNGEYEHDSIHLHITRANNTEFAVNRYVASFWGFPDYRDNDSWYFHGGVIACKLTRYKELTATEYNILFDQLY